jgi:capsular polysaccharide biosynthesis protein
MSLLDDITRSFFWRPGGCVPSLTHPDLADDTIARGELSPETMSKNCANHPLAVIELPDGKVIGDLRLVATRHDVVIGGLQSIFGSADPQNHYALQRRRFRLRQYRRGTALLIGTSNGDNYYHWLLDDLPRWKILEAAKLPDYDFVLLPEQAARFQEETLDRLQVPEVKRLRCAKNFVHQFERLIVPAMPFPVEEVAAWACDWVRSLFPEKGSGPEKLYLSRGAAGRRILANEPELEKSLAAQGFAVVRTDSMTVAEQARLFGSVRCVVAPHGAALTNMIFAPPGALLLELFHPQHKNRCYVNLAAACGHRYACLDGQSIIRPGDKSLAYRMAASAIMRILKEG